MAGPGLLFWQALGAFLALPGIVGFLIPWLLRPRGIAMNSAGFIPLGIGAVLLLWCVRDFYVVGKGSLAPWAPPKHLVTVGLYRLTRNPMYVAVAIILCGWALLYDSRTLWVYAGCVAIAFHLRVVYGEEPWLAKIHGDAWTEYRNRVPRWLL